MLGVDQTHCDPGHVQEHTFSKRISADPKKMDKTVTLTMVNKPRQSLNLPPQPHNPVQILPILPIPPTPDLDPPPHLRLLLLKHKTTNNAQLLTHKFHDKFFLLVDKNK